MTNFKRSSSGSNRNCCLICCSDSVNDEPEIDYWKLTKATEKIFQGLRIPPEHFQKVKDNNWMLSFCSKCIQVVEEIIELQRKTEILEMEIQWKLETLGRVAINNSLAAHTGCNGRKDKRTEELWKVFKNPVTQNFRQGLLPYPCVKLNKVDVETEAGRQLQRPKDDPFSSFEDDKKAGSSYGTGNLLEEEIKIEMDEDTFNEEMEMYFEDEERSNDDPFKVVRIIPTIKQENEHIDPSEDESFGHEDNTDVDSDGDFEISEADSDYDAGPSEPKPKRRKYETKRGKGTIKPVQITKDPEEVKKQLEGLIEGRDYFKCTKCDFFFVKPTTSNKTFIHSRRVTYHYSTFHNPVNRKNVFKTEDGTFCYKCTKCCFLSIISKNTKGIRGHSYQKLSEHYIKTHDQIESSDNDPVPGSSQQKLKRKCRKIPEGLTDGTDFLKCTKCEFVIYSWETTKRKLKGDLKQKLVLRRELGYHYAEKHSPVKPSNVSKTPGGEDCYDCTKCRFRSVVKIIRKKPDVKRSYQILGLHFMDVHDVEKDPAKESDVEKLKNLKEGKDYYQCPEDNCTFYVILDRETVHKKTPETLGRKKMLTHFNNCHNPELMNVLVQSVVDEEDGGNACFKCTQCDFKTVIKQRKGGKRDAKHSMTIHFNRRHTQPWKNFLTLYQYKVAEETCGEDDVVRCSHPGCDFSQQVNYVEGKSREECKYRAFQAVRSHFFYHDATKMEKLRGRSSALPFYRGNEKFEFPFTSAYFKEGNSSTEKIPIDTSTSENLKYPKSDHYRCWRCDFYVHIEYKTLTRKLNTSYWRYTTALKLMLHFNVAHNSEELALNDPDKLFEVVEGKEGYRCPRCDHYEEVRFDPEKHTDQKQGRKKARANIDKHFFFVHSIPERPTSPIPQVENVGLSNNDNEVHNNNADCCNGAKLRVGPQISNLQMAEGRIYEQSLPSGSDQGLYLNDGESPIIMNSFI